MCRSTWTVSCCSPTETQYGLDVVQDTIHDTAVSSGVAMLTSGPWAPAVSSTASPIPGFHLPPLSQLNVNPPLNNSDLVPFSPTEHLTQHGEAVTLIPFTRHPLNLVKKLSSLPRRIARDEDDVSFDPKQFKESLFAAYPLYVPLYLGEYALVEGGGQEKRVTTAAFASTDGPVRAWFLFLHCLDADAV